MKDTVEYAPGKTFIGQRIGYTPGCWKVSRAVARRVMDHFLGEDQRLPGPGWSTSLRKYEPDWPDIKIGGQSTLSNRSNVQWVVQLYEYKVLVR